MNSQFVTDSTYYFGWESSRISGWVNSIAQSLETRNDWRINNILNLNQQFGLKALKGEGGTVLEAGFGTGSLTISARLRGINIDGIDYTPGYVTLARQLASIAGFPEKEIYSSLQHGDIKDLQYPDNYFSMITCHGVLAYIDNIFAAIREFMRVLMPGGLLFLNSVDHRFPHESQYDIPYLPFMKRKLFEIWLKVLDKPLYGLDIIPGYISLPAFLGMAKSVGFDFINAKLTYPETKIESEIHKITNNTRIHYLDSDPGKIYLLAKKVKEEEIKTEGSTFIVLCQKPLEKVYPKSL